MREPEKCKKPSRTGLPALRSNIQGLEWDVTKDVKDIMDNYEIVFGLKYNRIKNTDFQLSHHEDSELLKILQNLGELQ